MSAVGCQPSRCDMLIACHYGSPSLWRQLMMSTWDLRPTPVAALPSSCSCTHILEVHAHTHTNTHTGSDQISQATSVLCSNVLIMIGFVCNYKHSETPISKSFIEFRPMGILGCFWKMHAAPTHTHWQTHTHFTSPKQTRLFELSARLLHTPWRPFAQSHKVNTSCLCTSCRAVPWAHLLQRHRPRFFTPQMPHPSKSTPDIWEKQDFES